MIIQWLLQRKYIIVLFLLFVTLLVLSLTFRYQTNRVSISPLSIISTTPLNNTLNYRILQPLSLQFSRPLSGEEKTVVQLISTPTFNTVSKWDDESRNLTLTPTSPLETNREYSVTVVYPKGTYSWKFTTISSDNLTLEDQLQLQTIADQKYATWQAEIFKNYPWFNELPVQTKKYFVFFDLGKKSFKAKLYPLSEGKTSIEKQIESLKSDVLNALQKLGIDTVKYKINWEIIPE